MNDITFKIAPRGEGKTKWLLSVANEYSETNPIFLLTNYQGEVKDFCEKYFNIYNKICPVYRFDEKELQGNEIILVDDLFSLNYSTSDITHIQRNCYKMFVTLNGSTPDNNNKSGESCSYVQLSMFEKE